MSEFIQINLTEIINEWGEDATKTFLSHFSCPLNTDVQNFLHNKAIEFSKRDFSKTHLVLWLSDDEQEMELIGYYTLSMKNITVYRDSVSKNTYKKLLNHAIQYSGKDHVVLPVPLIAQLGKNYSDGNDALIDGDELLKMALEKIKLIQNEIGGRYCYLECEDKPKLLKFYQNNGFTPFGKRPLDADEDGMQGNYLIQLIKLLQ